MSLGICDSIVVSSSIIHIVVELDIRLEDKYGLTTDLRPFILGQNTVVVGKVVRTRCKH